MLFSHRRHGPPFVDAIVELDRSLGTTWLLRRAQLRGVVQDERLTHEVLGRAAGGTRARAMIAVAGGGTVFFERRALPFLEGELILAPRGSEPLARCSDTTVLEIEWDPAGAIARTEVLEIARREIGQATLAAARELAAELRSATAASSDALVAATTRLFDQLAIGGLAFDVEVASRELAARATEDEQRLCDEIDRVLTDLHDGPQAVALEEALGCSRRTLLRRTQSLCKRYHLPGLAADDWRTVRDSYRLLIGAIFATHPTVTTRTLASMLGYASSDALCHAFANAGLPSPTALRDEWGERAPSRDVALERSPSLAGSNSARALR